MGVHTMNSVWVKPTEELPSSGFFVNCDEGPYAMYGSYEHILSMFEAWCTPDELKLMLWKPACTCGNTEECGLCDAAEFHEEIHCSVCFTQVRIGTMGFVKFDELDRYGNKCDGDPNTDDAWDIADFYQAAYTKVHGHPVVVTDEEAYNILWDEKTQDYKEFFQSSIFF